MHACTITSCRYWAHARVLAESFLRWHPGSELAILLSDGIQPDRPFPAGVELLMPSDIGIDRDEFHRRATMYGAQGVAGSLKPALLATLLKRHGPVLFVDADGCVYDELTGLTTEPPPVLLSPHIREPNDQTWDDDGVEQLLLRAGVFNGGLIAVGPGAEPFLAWWHDRTARRCVFDERHALTVEQTWLTLVPALFPHGVIADPGVNAAGWNLAHRDVSWREDKPWLDGAPLRHFHFACSYDPEHPQRLTAQAHAHWWPRLEERPGAARLSREYAEQLLAHGYREARERPVAYDVMPDGMVIEPWMREVYRAGLIEAEAAGAAEPPNPFAGGAEAFSAWVRERATGQLEAAQPQQAGAMATAELMAAMSRTGELLARIHELESIRDDAIAWAERASADLEDAKRVLAERDQLIAALQAQARPADSPPPPQRGLMTTIRRLAAIAAGSRQ